MGGLSFGHWLIVLVVVFLLFGRGRISETMEDFGKGIRSFRRGLADDVDGLAAGPAEHDGIDLSARVSPEKATGSFD